MKGKGPLLGIPALPIAPAAPLTVQLINEDSGVCWETRFGAPFLQDDDTRFRDRESH